MPEVWEENSQENFHGTAVVGNFPAILLSHIIVHRSFFRSPETGLRKHLEDSLSVKVFTYHLADSCLSCLLIMRASRNQCCIFRTI